MSLLHDNRESSSRCTVCGDACHHNPPNSSGFPLRGICLIAVPLLILSLACGGGSPDQGTADPGADSGTTDHETGSTGLVVAFESASSSSAEEDKHAVLTVVLSQAASETIQVDYAVVGGTARQHDAGTGADFTLADGEVVFEPGVTRAELDLSVVNDATYESDETVIVSLSNASGATLGEISTHTLDIIDEDRPNLYSVSDFGALGDGVTDDTDAIQDAVVALEEAGGGVLLFPEGTYVVTEVEIYPGIAYVGYQATMRRPARKILEKQGLDPKQVRTFNTTYAPYLGKEDSQPLIIQGLSFDGNRPEQGEYQQWELEQAALIFLSADASQPGRLRAFVEDCRLIDGVGDGIHARQNLDIAVDNCEAIDVFRGGFTLTGGNTTATVTRLTTSGDTDPGGIDIETDTAGYGENWAVDVTLDSLHLIDGDLDIGLKPGSTVNASNVVADAPFYVYGLDSTIRFTDSIISVGAYDEKLNRIVCPGNLSFENSDLIATRKETDRETLFFSVLSVFWQHPVCADVTGESHQNDQHVSLVDTRILMDDNFVDADLVYAIYSLSDIADGVWGSGNRLTIEGGCIDEGFDEQVVLYHESSVVPEISDSTTTCKPD